MQSAMNFAFQYLTQGSMPEAFQDGGPGIAAPPPPVAADSDGESDNMTEPDDDDEGINPAKLDDADRELYEKFKQQEREEREEIELELKAHQELVRHQEELRLREKELQQTQDLLQHKAQSLSSHSPRGGPGPAANGSPTGGGGSSSRGSSRPGSGEGMGGGGGGGVAGLGGSAGGNNNNNSSSSNNNNNNNNSNHHHLPHLGNNGINGGSSITNSLGGLNGGGGIGGGPGGVLGGLGGSRLSAEELRAHVQQAAQLAALGQFSAMSPHLSPHLAGPRDLNGLHPLRAAGMLPTPSSFAAAAAAAAAASASAGGGGGVVPPGPPEKFPRPSSQTPQPPGSLRSSPEPGGDGRAHHWTFEEQFKQLYELSDDPQRKEFLDDLFAFMQKRGSPVNRIPIMAKQTLDLYELFRLVVSKGGLVEVINKKLWREITKGLNLPSSITSAAFTLRTQYMKYLYPYECDKLKLSNPSELQAAIDGNRREGRRSSYGYDLSPGPTLVPPTHHLNGSLINGKLGRGSPGGEQWTNGLCAADFWGRPQAMESWRAASPVLDLSNKTSVSAAAAWAAQSRVPPHSLPAALDSHPPPMGEPPSWSGTLVPIAPAHLTFVPPLISTMPPPMYMMPPPMYTMPPPSCTVTSVTETSQGEMPQDFSLNGANRDNDGFGSRKEDEDSQPPTPRPTIPRGLTERDALAMEAASRAMEEATRKMEAGRLAVAMDNGGSPPRKRLMSEDDRVMAHTPSAHLKITSRSDGRSEVDSSLVVTMEVNGIMYQGVLFAHSHTRRM